MLAFHIHACALAFHEAEMIGFKRKFEIKHKKTKKTKKSDSRDSTPTSNMTRPTSLVNQMSLCYCLSYCWS